MGEGSLCNLYGFPLGELTKQLEAIGEKPYRAQQLFDWLYVKKVHSFSEMSNLSKDLRETLSSSYSLFLPSIFKKEESQDGTIKLLLEMEDGAKVECVLMRYDYGNALCVSSEVGCSMACAFCASGLLRKERGLTAAEMVGQVMVMNALLEKEMERVSHVVVMGTGEPFDNYDEVMRFIRIINEQKGLAIGARHITVSTCGIIPGIQRYSEEGLQINLAISLHAPNDEIRAKLMPIARKYPLKDLMPAVKEYVEKSGRRVTFEYIMLRGVNDSLDCAAELVRLIGDTFGYVNLIPFNPVKEKPFERADRKVVEKFRDYLNNHGIKCTIRKEFGTDIDAACGQLRVKYERKSRQ